MKHLSFFKFFAQNSTFSSSQMQNYAITHAALESGYGSSNLAKKHHNYFGMSGKGVKTKDGRHFASYQNATQGIMAYQNLISQRYPTATQAISPSNYISILIFEGYGGKGFRHTQQAHAYTRQFVAMHGKILAAEQKHIEQQAIGLQTAIFALLLLLFSE
jgi:flagellum-specific peptidoglycan hydrolase FlgJ